MKPYRQDPFFSFSLRCPWHTNAFLWLSRWTGWTCSYYGGFCRPAKCQLWADKQAGKALDWQVLAM